MEHGHTNALTTPTRAMTTPPTRARLLRQDAAFPPVLPARRPDPVSPLEADLLTTGEMMLEMVVKGVTLNRGAGTGSVELEVPALAADLQQSGGNTITLSCSEAVMRHFYPGMRFTTVWYVHESNDGEDVR